MYSEWRDPSSLPRDRLQRGAHGVDQDQPFNKCFVHATRGGETEDVEEVTIPVLSQLDEKWAQYLVDFLRRMAGGDKPWFLYHNTRGAHFDNYPSERFLGKLPGQAPDKDTIVADDVVGRLVDRSRRPAAGGHARDRDPGQRPGDGDLARRRLHALPMREGLDVGRAACGCPRSSPGRR